MNLVLPSKRFYEGLFAEDQIDDNHIYRSTLPQDKVECSLKIKSNLMLSGLSFFFGAFDYLGESDLENWNEIFKKYEGKTFSKDEQKEINFSIPFNIALTGERIALNLLQRSSSISTFTQKHVEIAKQRNIKILDTRKTTPGLRTLEKYAVRVGGGHNHRFNQTDLWMIKDNHKSFFGGVKKSVDFFQSVGSFYKEIELEVHSQNEFFEGVELGVKNFMLDNFSVDEIQKIVSQKPKDIKIEVSGGINLENITTYLIAGVDAISIGSLTYGAPPVDLSMKLK